jgi:pantothenate synthetase
VEIVTGDVRIAVAAWLGEVRLIDNVLVAGV